MLFFAEPGKTAWLPPCPFFSATGLFCPGCGNTRALHALVHGRVAQCVGHNALLIPALVYLLALCLFPRLGRVVWANWLLLTLTVAFAVMRNLPWWPFCLLAP